MTPPYEGDLDAVLANIPPTDRARALVEHHDRIADAFVAEYKAGLYGAPRRASETTTPASDAT